MLNLTGMLKAPEQPAPLVRYVATYSDGFSLRRKEINAPNRLVAYAKAKAYGPDGCQLTQLRKQRGEVA